MQGKQLTRTVHYRHFKGYISKQKGTYNVRSVPEKEARAKVTKAPHCATRLHTRGAASFSTIMWADPGAPSAQQLSPTVLVNNWSITDWYLYLITLQWRPHQHHRTHGWHNIVRRNVLRLKKMIWQVWQGKAQHTSSTATAFIILRSNKKWLPQVPTKEAHPLFNSHLGHWNGAFQAGMDRNLSSRFKKETQLTTFCFCFAKRQQWEPYQNT